MSGHSKWHNIRLKKGRMDAKRGKVFTRISKEIMLAVKEGGPDPDGNHRLAAAINKAKEVNMPRVNIKRAIDKASGEASGVGLEEITYEGYGPHGVAILIEAATDNRNRTIPEVRNILANFGGSMGAAGCVAWMFDRKGIIILGADIMDEEELFEIVLEAGAEDMKKDEGDGHFEIITEFKDFTDVKKVFEEKKIPMESADVSMIPRNEVKLNRSQAETILKLMEALEDQDDVQNVHANFNIPLEILQAMEDAD